METMPTLNATLRTETGKGAARKYRKNGLVPGIVYARGAANLHFCFAVRELEMALRNPRRHNTVLNLKVDGHGDHKVMLKDYQVHPLRRQVMHADFSLVREGEAVRVQVPVVLTGKCKGVIDGGILQQSMRQITLLALPQAIPVQIEQDITALTLGQALHVRDLTLPEGLKAVDDGSFTVAVIVAPAAEEKKAEEAPGAAAAAATPAAGAAPAAGTAAPAAKPAEKAKK